MIRLQKYLEKFSIPYSISIRLLVTPSVLINAIKKPSMFFFFFVKLAFCIYGDTSLPIINNLLSFKGYHVCFIMKRNKKYCLSQHINCGIISLFKDFEFGDI